MAALLFSALALVATASPSQGAGNFASVSATATVRILTPALIGADYGAPQPGMEPHTLTLALPDGRNASLTVYEFE